MKVISYNLRKHRAANELAGLAERHAPDILCLQECDTNDLPETIAGLQFAHSTQGNRLGLALYYRENTYRATEDEVVDHYRRVAQVGLPIVGYNNPVDTKVDLNPRLIARLHGEGRDLAFVDDQRGHPTFTADLAPVLRRLAVDRRSGVHHVTNQGAVSWYEFTREVVAGLGGDPDAVGAISTADLDPPRPAPRPANSVLDNSVLRSSGLPLLRDFRAPLAELLARL